MIIYGKQVCLYALENHSEKILRIYFAKEIPREIFARFSKLDKPIIKPDFKKMQSLCRGGNHQGYALEITEPTEFSFNFFKDSSRILVLVGVTDIGNIGSIFRSALFFGCDGIILSNHFDTSGVARASSGAFLGMPYLVRENSLSLINDLKQHNFTLFGSCANVPESARQADKWALFLGSEGEGLPRRIVKKMDGILSITTNRFNSLNVSVAAGILIYRMVNNELHRTI